MRHSRIATLAAAAALPAIYLGSACLTPAAADTMPSWYVGGEGAAVFQRDADTSNGTAPQTNYDTGYGLGGIVGYDFGNGWRAEGELGYQNSDLSNGGGDTSALYGMVSGYYDFNTGTKFVPYVGAGVGYAEVRMDGTPNGAPSIDDQDGALAYQLAAGVGYKVSDQTTLFAGYRWLQTQDASFTNAAGNSVDTAYSNHSVVAGVRFKF